MEIYGHGLIVEDWLVKEWLNDASGSGTLNFNGAKESSHLIGAIDARNHNVKRLTNTSG